MNEARWLRVHIGIDIKVCLDDICRGGLDDQAESGIKRGSTHAP